MYLYTQHEWHFKLDGGAMFGVVPQSIWKKHNPPDAINMCSWATRCLLIEDGNRLILVDTGMRDKQSDTFSGYFYLHGDEPLERSLLKAVFACRSTGRRVGNACVRMIGLWWSPDH